MKKWIALLLLTVPLVQSLQAGDGKQLIYGRVVSITDTGLLISCAPAKHSHPAAFYGIADSRKRFVFVAGASASLRLIGKIGALTVKPLPNDDDVVALVGVEAGEYTYTTVMGARNTVAKFVNAEVVPAYSVVAPVDSHQPQPAATPQSTWSTTSTPSITLHRSW